MSMATKSMKVSRRGLFGVAAGAAAVGPSAVKSALERVATAPFDGPAVGGGIYGYANKVPENPNMMPSADYLIESLKQLAREKDDVRSNYKPDVGLARDLRIDGLRSVSVANRARMISEDRNRRNIENQLSWIDKRVEDVKKQLGILGHFI